MKRHTVHALLSPLLVTVFTVLTASTDSATAATGKPHEHGALKLDVAIEGNLLTIAMEAPLDNLLGFERAPRTDTERKAASAMLARLRSPDKGKPLFTPDAAAQCTLSKAEVQAPVVEADAKAAGKNEHADLDAIYEYACVQPQALLRLDIGLFDAYSRIQRIDVQVAGPKAQSKITLRRPARSIPLSR